LDPSRIATDQLQISTFPTHSGGFVMMLSYALSELPFVSTMALKALEEAHSLTASSPTLEFHPSHHDT
jgi:hypothetical protein